MRTAEPPRAVVARPLLPLAALALAAACLLGGCAGARPSSEYAEAREYLSRARIPKTTVTLEEIGEKYPQEVLPVAGEPFTPHYHRITEAEAFDWPYLEELAAKRVKILRRSGAETAEEQRKAQVRREKEEKKKAAAETRREKKEKVRATVEAAKTDSAAGKTGAGRE